MKKERNLLKVLSNADCDKAYKEMLINADKHRELALTIAKSGQYGSGVSHLILGTEEVVKALLLQIQSIGINIRDIPGVYLFFTDHIIKHNFAILTNLMYKPIKLFMGLVYKMREEIHNPEIKQEYTEDEKAVLSKDENRIKVIFKNLPELFNWWEEANKAKNKGFYVDYSHSLETPMQVTDDEFRQALKITDEFRTQIFEVVEYFEKMTEQDRLETVENAKKHDFTQILLQVIEARKEQKRLEQNPPKFSL
jgi:AbiV family abortive infection protein